MLQEEKEGAPASQTCNHLDYFRKEKGQRTEPRVFDDGNLNLEHPASVKAVTEVDGIDRKTMARYNASSYAKNQLCQISSNPWGGGGWPYICIYVLYIYIYVYIENIKQCLPVCFIKRVVICSTRAKPET